MSENPTVCKHGQQAGICFVCVLDKKVAELQQQDEMLKAQALQDAAGVASVNIFGIDVKKT